MWLLLSCAEFQNNGSIYSALSMLLRIWIRSTYWLQFGRKSLFIYLHENPKLQLINISLLLPLFFAMTWIFLECILCTIVLWQTQPPIAPHLLLLLSNYSAKLHSITNYPPSKKRNYTNMLLNRVASLKAFKYLSLNFTKMSLYNYIYKKLTTCSVSSPLKSLLMR